MSARPQPASPCDLSPLGCEFINEAEERRFQHHHLADVQRQLRVSLMVCTVFYVAFSMTDVAVLGYGEASYHLLLARLAFAAVACGGVIASWLHPNSVRVAWAAATTAELACMASFACVVIMRPHQMGWHSMSLSIMLMLLYLYIPNRLLYAVGVALAATGSFILVAILHGQMGNNDMLTMVMLLLLANIFGSVAARRYQRLLRQEFRIQSVLVGLSTHDPLTGCFNRRHLHDKLLENEISRAQRYGLSLTVIMCDLDHFKEVNDTHGHAAGDTLLCAFSHLLQNMTRDSVDSVVRYGGEEFLLILPETDIVGGTLLAERLRTAFADMRIPFDGADISSSASFGVATVDFSLLAQDVTPDLLVTTADRLMYAAKNAGRNQVCTQELHQA